jgi:hypothetical protein
VASLRGGLPAGRHVASVKLAQDGRTNRDDQAAVQAALTRAVVAYGDAASVASMFAVGAPTATLTGVAPPSYWAPSYHCVTYTPVPS